MKENKLEELELKKQFELDSEKMLLTQYEDNIKELLTLYYCNEDDSKVFDYL
eukprot:Pgem_evm1s14993